MAPMAPGNAGAQPRPGPFPATRPAQGGRAQRGGLDAATPRIALLMEGSQGFGRQLLCGVARYAQLHGPWCFDMAPGGIAQSESRLRRWAGAGIIARITSDQVARAVQAAGVPTVLVRMCAEPAPWAPCSAPVCELVVDAAGVARAAADHLRARLFPHYAFVGAGRPSAAGPYEHAFRFALARHGLQPHVYPATTRRHEGTWEREQVLLAQWIRGLPKPVGILACSDDRGREVLEACRLAGAAVPEEAAVLGVGNDEIHCALSNPPLSSIPLDAEMAGYRAAQALDQMMQGAAAPPARILVEAQKVVVRRSTEVLTIEDPDVAMALEFIRRAPGRGMSVEAVVQEVAVSRRSLEKRFRETLGRTILEAIQETRLERAKRLLVETKDSIAKVAETSGFGSTGYFIQFFQSRVGQTPRRFRTGQAGRLGTDPIGHAGAVRGAADPPTSEYLDVSNREG